jgi:hypothetical protein
VWADLSRAKEISMGTRVKRAFVLGVLAVASLACGSTTPAMPNPVTEPIIDQPGRYIARYRDSVIEIVLDTKFAANNLGEEWLILNTAMSGMTGANTEVDRELVSIRAPNGRTIPLPSYREFNAAYSKLARAVRRAALASDPLDFTRASRRDCLIDFFPLPGSGRSARKVLHVSKNDLCVGMLYFPIPNGVQPGNWKLILEFEETEAILPFTLEVERP